MSENKCPEKINIKKKSIIHTSNGRVLNNVLSVLKYDDFYKVTFQNSTYKTYSLSELTFVESPLIILDYISDIASMLKSNDFEEKSFLSKQIDSIDMSRESVLYKFIYNKFSHVNDTQPIIYPFSTNKSQKQAVYNALNNSLSIIQGPPGTGKTQTILNIIANCIFRGKTVAVLSGNNEAIKNVKDKLDANGYGCLNAYLGNQDNIKEFFGHTHRYEIDFEYKMSKSDAQKKFNENQKNIDSYLTRKSKILELKQLLSELEIEAKNNERNYNTDESLIPKSLLNTNLNSSKVLQLIALSNDDHFCGLINRIKALFLLGFSSLKVLTKNQVGIQEYLRHKYYITKIKEIRETIETEEKILASFDDVMEKQKILSKYLFDITTAEKVEKNKLNCFTLNRYRFNYEEFVQKYPIVYSTTHAIKYCSGRNYLYDYVIIDESSQVDLVTAFIAFSCAKNVVLVGDSKQLPHVVKSSVAHQVDFIRDRYKNDGYNIDDCYDYVKNNILECVSKKYSKIPNQLLEEHYRCDPSIINFCSKEFYNGALIVCTKHEEDNGIYVITHESHGKSHYGNSNEREIEIIRKEILPTIDDNVGIISPYRDQVKELNNNFSESFDMIDTIHKFQGKESDNIILSTVANDVRTNKDGDIEDFVNNPNLMNVAISRAKKKLYIVASENIVNKEGTILNDLKKFSEYYNCTDSIKKSSVYSVFDLLYKNYNKELKKLKSRLLNISNYDSENIVATIISDICNNQGDKHLAYLHNYPLKYIINASKLDDDRARQFVSNKYTHCDFVIYNKLDKSIKLIIEVDGATHSTIKQQERDSIKDKVIKDAGIEMLRIPTTSSRNVEEMKALIGAYMH